MRVQSLGGEDPLEKEMATHFSILDWGIPRTEEPNWPQSMGLQKVRHHLATKHDHLPLLGSRACLHILSLLSPETVSFLWSRPSFQFLGRPGQSVQVSHVALESKVTPGIDDLGMAKL